MPIVSEKSSKKPSRTGLLFFLIWQTATRRAFCDRKFLCPFLAKKIIKNTLKDRHFLIWKTATRRAFCDRKVLCPFLAKNHQKYPQRQAFFNMKNRYKESPLRHKSFMPIFSEKIIKNTLKDRPSFLIWKIATRRAFCDRKVLYPFLAKKS